MSSQEETDQAIEVWRYRKLLNMLAQSRGAGTSCITLILPPKSQISQANSMLTVEYGTASNIKSRVNRLSVLSAITSTQQKLKLFNRVPDNGLCVFVGTVLNEEGKEKKISFALTPFKPINTSLYLCDSRFHVEALEELLETDAKWGFIIMDGNGSLFGTLSGNTREVVHKFGVDLPKKHGRGGQSALRFSRLREEARRNYVRKVAELAVQHFITNDKVNVQGLVLAGSAELKTDLSGSDLFDPRLAAKVVKIVDVSYGGENGFNQAIELAADTLANVKFVVEKRLIQKYFDEIALDTGKYCFGISDTLKALDMGAVETLIVWENLETVRNTLRNAAGEEIIVFSNPDEKDREKFIDKSTGLEMEQAAEPQPLLEWFAEKYKEFGATLEFVTNKSQEGSQFVKGFGGIGGILRYKVDFADLGDLEGDDDEFYGSDEDSDIWSIAGYDAPLSHSAKSDKGAKAVDHAPRRTSLAEESKVEEGKLGGGGRGREWLGGVKDDSLLAVKQQRVENWAARANNGTAPVVKDHQGKTQASAAKRVPSSTGGPAHIGGSGASAGAGGRHKAPPAGHSASAPAGAGHRAKDKTGWGHGLGFSRVGRNAA